MIDTITSIDIETSHVLLDNVSNLVDVQPRLALSIFKLGKEDLGVRRVVNPGQFRLESKGELTVLNMRISSMLAKMTSSALVGTTGCNAE